MLFKYSLTLAIALLCVGVCRGRLIDTEAASVSNKAQYIPHTGPYPYAELQVAETGDIFLPKELRTIGRTLRYDVCYRSLLLNYVLFRDTSVEGVSLSARMVVYDDAGCKHEVKSVDIADGASVSTAGFDGETVVVWAAQIPRSGSYFVTWRVASDEAMSTGLAEYHGYTDVCYPKCHVDVKSYCMYSIVNETEMTLHVHGDPKCIDAPDVVQTLAPNRVSSIGTQFGNFSAVAGIRKDIDVTACDVYDTHDGQKFIGTVLFNSCSPDPNGFGYVQLFGSLGNGIYAQYMTNETCSKSMAYTQQEFEDVSKDKSVKFRLLLGDDRSIFTIFRRFTCSINA